jgi:hypothetical protein
MIAAMATARRADMFTADGKPSDDDPREHRARLGDERTTPVEALRCQRLTLEMNSSGLDAEAMARRCVEPSTMSLLGLVRHLAEVERRTFRVLMAGQAVPRLFCSDTERDGDFDGAPAWACQTAGLVARPTRSPRSPARASGWGRASASRCRPFMSSASRKTSGRKPPVMCRPVVKGMRSR